MFWLRNIGSPQDCVVQITAANAAFPTGASIFPLKQGLMIALPQTVVRIKQGNLGTELKTMSTIRILALNFS